jgi:4-amino-4-deoxy-L-arabinose transferase-like glycosyltransferase
MANDGVNSDDTYEIDSDAGGYTPSLSKRKFNSRITGLVIAALIVIPFGIGKYIELGTNLPWDNAAHAYSAQHILSGAEIGVDEKPSASVGTLLLNMAGVKLFGFNQTGPKVISLVLQIATLLAMFYITRELFGIRPAAICVIIAAVYLASPMVARDSLKEQYLTSFAVLGISCFVIWQLGGHIWWGLLAGAFAGFAPLFKATGISALSAIGLYLFLQPLVKNKTWACAIKELLVIVVGLMLAMMPVCIWLANTNVSREYYPYWFVLKLFFINNRGLVGDYILRSHRIYPFANQLESVLRHYYVLGVTISLAMSAISLRFARFIWSNKSKKVGPLTCERFVLLFAIWWMLDMAFVWISPRSYWHYYLPLNASAAVLSGYVFALYYNRADKSPRKRRWRNIGLIGIICMAAFSWNILDDYGDQFLDTVKRQIADSKEPWQLVGRYIREHSSRDDKIYVWGWMPGIYIEAQRFSPTARACSSEMQSVSSRKLSLMVTQVLSSFEKDKPKFIVDTYKIHFPWDRPELELWPFTESGPLPRSEKQIQAYDEKHHRILKDTFGQDEVAKYESLKPFREFIMKHYEIIPGPFGENVLFELKNDY